MSFLKSNWLTLVWVVVALIFGAAMVLFAVQTDDLQAENDALTAEVEALQDTNAACSSAIGNLQMANSYLTSALDSASQFAFSAASTWVDGAIGWLDEADPDILICQGGED